MWEVLIKGDGKLFKGSKSMKLTNMILISLGWGGGEFTWKKKNPTTIRHLRLQNLENEFSIKASFISIDISHKDT